VLDFERIADGARTDLIAEQTFQQIGIHRQRTLREHRVPELLKLFENFVIEPGIVVIWTREDDDADTFLAVELIEDLARAPLNVRLVREQLAKRDLDRSLVLASREPQQGTPRVEQLLTEQRPIREVDERAQVLDALLREDVA